MKRFFSKNGIWLLSAVAIVTVVLCIMSAIGSGFLRNVAGVIASPFRAAGSAIAGWAEDIGGHFDSVSQLQEENAALREQIAALEQQVRQQQADSVENDRLRSLLELRQKRSDLQFESAKIIDTAASNWESGFTVNKGTKHGIAEGNCAVDAYGNLVGVITDVGYNWSTVTTVLDTSSEIGAMVFRTETPGIAAGDLQLMSENHLALNYLSDSDTLINGDLVVTSGLGGYYPSGLPIGTVLELRTDDSGLDRYAILAPRAALDSLTEVFLITDFDVVE